MSLGAPSYLFALIVVPILALLFQRAQKKSVKEQKALLDREVRVKLLTSQISVRRRREYGLILFIFTLVCLALIRPQFGFREVVQRHNGHDLLFVIDVSKSMLAKDLSPSRLERVRFLIIDLLSILQGDRVGLITFAGVSFVESPLTYDYGTFRLFLDDLSPDLIPVQGTNLESALDKALEVLQGKNGDLSKVKDRAIILFSDGEDVAGDTNKAVKKLKQAEIKVYTVGVGSESGAPVPAETGGYKRDRSGKAVLSKLNRQTLENLANETGGAYLGGALTGSNLKNFYTQNIVGKLQRSESTGGIVRIWNEYYQVPLALALAGLIWIYGVKKKL